MTLEKNRLRQECFDQTGNIILTNLQKSGLLKAIHKASIHGRHIDLKVLDRVQFDFPKGADNYDGAIFVQPLITTSDVNLCIQAITPKLRRLFVGDLTDKVVTVWEGVDDECKNQLLKAAIDTHIQRCRSSISSLEGRIQTEEHTASMKRYLEENRTSLNSVEELYKKFCQGNANIFFNLDHASLGVRLPPSSPSTAW